MVFRSHRSFSFSSLEDILISRGRRSWMFLSKSIARRRQESCHHLTAMDSTALRDSWKEQGQSSITDKQAKKTPRPAMSTDASEHEKSLHQVAREGDVETMTKLLGSLKTKEVRNRINELNPEQFSPLHYAARHNHYDMVSLLINKGADVRIRGRDGLSPLHLLALHVRSLTSSPSIEVEKYHPETEALNNNASELRMSTRMPKFIPNRTPELRHKSPTAETPDRNVSRYLRKYAITRRNKTYSWMSNSGKDLLRNYWANEFGTGSLSRSFSNSSLNGVENTHETIVELLVSHGAEVNCKDIHDFTPLHYAAMRGNVRIASDLLRCKSINVEARDKDNMTPLHVASINNSEEIVRLLLKSDANVRSRDDSHATPLLRAAAEGNLCIVRVLLEYAQEQHGSYTVSQMMLDQNANESTALHLAIENGHLDVVQDLIRKGADVHAPRQKYDFPLHLAATIGNEDIVQILLENDKGVNCVNANQETPLHRATEFNHVAIMDLLLSHGADIERKDKKRLTPLLIAARCGHVEAIECLLQRGADTHSVDEECKTIIHWAVECNRHDALVAMLKDYRTHDLIRRTEHFCNTPLHVAAGKGFLAITQTLVDLGCPLELKNKDERTALHLAALNGKTKIVRSLLNSEASLSTEDEDGNTPLHLAASMGHVNVVNTLLESGSNLEIRNGRLWTPMDIAAFNGHVGVTRRLLEAGSTINIQDKTKTTALHLAAQAGSVDVVMYLLNSGADATLRNNQGLNCLEVAIENNRRDVVKAIVQSNHWEKAMRSVRFTPDDRLIETPLRTLIKKMPEIVEAVLVRCTHTNNLYPEHPLYTVHFDYTLLDDAHVVLETAMSASSCPSLSPIKCDAEAVGDGFYQHDQDHKDHPKTIHRKKTKDLLDGQTIKENHPLMIMVRSGQQRLLTHSVCVTLLHLKWIRFGRYFYYANLFLYVTFLGLLTTYVLTTPPPIIPDDPLYKQLVVVGPDNDTEITLVSVCDIWETNRRNGEDTFDITFMDTLSKTSIIIFIIVHMFKELFVLYTMRLHYFGIDILVSWGCYVSSLLLVIDFTECALETGNREVWQWQVGAAAIFLAWINLALTVSKFPYLGIYVVMFTHVCRTFCKVFIVFIFFIVAFAVTFHTVLYYEGSFTNAFKGMIGVTLMMLGEFNFDTLYREGTVLYPIPAYLTFVLAVLFVSMVSMNLLTGLAVSDIKEVKAKANLELMAMQVDLVLNIESMLPVLLRQRFTIKERSFMPNLRRSHWLQRMVDRLNNTSEMKEALGSSGKALNASSTTFRCRQRDIDRIRESQDSIVGMTRDLSESVEILRTDNIQLQNMVAAILRHQGIKFDDSNENDDGDNLRPSLQNNA